MGGFDPVLLLKGNMGLGCWACICFGSGLIKWVGLFIWFGKNNTNGPFGFIISQGPKM